MVNFVRRHALASLIAAVFIVSPFFAVAVGLFDSERELGNDSVSSLAVPGTEVAFAGVAALIAVMIGAAILAVCVWNERRKI